MSFDNNIEILQIIDAVSKEKNINKDIVISAMESAIIAVTNKKYGNEHEIVAKIDKVTGEICIFRLLEVVEDPTNPYKHISLEDALNMKNDAQLGDKINDRLPPLDLGRVAAQVSRHIISKKISEAEAQKRYEDYIHRKGEILSGVVRRNEKGHLIIDFGRTDGILKRDQQIPNERFSIGDRIKVYLKDVLPMASDYQLILSRTDNNFVAKLFEVEVPEIYDKIIEIKAVSRRPGMKAKVAIFASDNAVDIVGACVGFRGARVRAISNELSGEKIDIVLWDSNIAQFIINAMMPAEISKILFDKEKNTVRAIVNESQLSPAIGKGGSNVRLVSDLTGQYIEIMTEAEEVKSRLTEQETISNLFMNSLGVDDMTARLLISYGFNDIESIAAADTDSLYQIEGLSKDFVDNIKNNAESYVDSENADIIENLEKLGVEQDLLDILDIAPDGILKLAEQGIKTIEDLSVIKPQEFVEMLPDSGLSDDEILNLILFAQSQVRDNN